MYNASKKNQGGAAFNIVTLDYDKTQAGRRLNQIDDDAKILPWIDARFRRRRRVAVANRRASLERA